MGLRDLPAGEGLFKNEESLDPEWLPKNLPFREAQHHQIANCIKPLLQGRTGRNCIISGAPGIGKTAAVKLVLKELEDNPDVNAPDIYVLYVNCWQKNTTYKIFVDFCEQLGYKFTQNKNTEDLFKIIENIVNKKAAVFAFDEVDKVEDVDFLYHIYTDILKKTILMITNHPLWYASVDERIRSRLIPEKIVFQQYSRDEIRGILKHRMDAAFSANRWDDAAFEMIVDKTVSAGDVRIGLHLLREAGMAAEDESARRITVFHAERALSKLSEFSIKPEEALSEDARVILKLVKSQSGRIGDLFRAYQDQGGTGTYKTFQRRIETLEKGGFVETKKIVGGKEGTTTLVSGKNKSLDDY
ncbi:MAG: AAA family ATPase [Candidatus Woesearchaeota archaeon]